jgi:hypothetical protein
VRWNGPARSTRPEVTAHIPAESDALADALSTEGLPEQVRVRREKLERLRGTGNRSVSSDLPANAHARADSGRGR